MLICYGEILMRLSAPDRLRFPQATQLDVHYGGAEANVASAYTQMGGRAKMVTALPTGGIGDAAVASIAGLGVDTTYVNREEGRIGIYFLEKGASYRPSKVIYDRQNSVFASVHPGDTLETTCEITRARHPFYFAKGEGKVDGKLCVTAEFSFVIQEPKEEA